MFSPLFRKFVASLALTVPSLAPAADNRALSPQAELNLDLSRERLVTVLGTNDMHGGIEAVATKNGDRQGGMTILEGVVATTRLGLKSQYGDSAGVILLDAGDQAQGTLASNMDEGSTIFETMKLIGYTAAIPGNHGYDFGPKGPYVDQLPYAVHDPVKSKEILIRTAKQIQSVFPFISANTYVIKSLVDLAGKPVKGVEPVNCKTASKIDWSRAKRPSYLKAEGYLIKEVAGLKIAIIGLDHYDTPHTTTLANVEDLCFRDEAEAYLELRQQIEAKEKADVYVLVVHDGDPRKGTGTLTKLLTAIGPKVDAVVAGHTHANNLILDPAPAVQSLSGGQFYGRIDLVYDTVARKVVRSRAGSAIPLLAASCPDNLPESMCRVDETGVRYEDFPLQLGVGPGAKVAALVKKAVDAVAKNAARKLGETAVAMAPDRISENNLGDALTSELLEFTRADGVDTQAFVINMGTFRTQLGPKSVDYGQFFKFFPFSTRIVRGKMPTSELVSAIRQATKTCGKDPTLMVAGLKVVFSRICDEQNWVSGELKSVDLLLANGATQRLEPADEDTPAELTVASTDFLVYSGGDNYEQMKKLVPMDLAGPASLLPPGEKPLGKGDLGSVREQLTRKWLKENFFWAGKKDGRWRLEQ